MVLNKDFKKLEEIPFFIGQTKSWKIDFSLSKMPCATFSYWNNCI